MVQSFLDRAEQIWSGWEIRFLVLLSLLLQIVLIVFGKWRKYGCSTWVEGVIWAAYLLSDSVATFSLGIISTTQRNSSPSTDKSIQASEAVMVFWAPFLLVHLGGPDTITAYSLEDNELWLRHLFGFLVQVGVVLYLLVLSWIHSSVNSDSQPLTYIAILMFVSGVLKYGEKTWVLWSSSWERFKKTSLPHQLPPVRFSSRSYHTERPNANNQLLTDVIPEAELLVTADWFFKSLKSICAKVVLESQYRTDGLQLMWRRSSEAALKVIEIELGFLYDVFFTKASVAHSPTGFILRSISLVSSSAAFLAFVIIVDKHNFSPKDIIITYVLVVGAISAEIYAIVMIIYSEQTLLHLKKQKKGLGNLLYRSISASPSASMERKMWSGSMAQYNLIGFCIGDKPSQYGGIQKFLGIYESLEIRRYKTWEKVTTDLKEMIFANVKERCGFINTTSDLDTVLNSRGAYKIRKRQMDPFLEWSVESLKLDRSILMWHIATDICYYFDLKFSKPSPSLKARVSKSLSDYMLYLVVFRPFMLPTGNWEIEYRKMCGEAMGIIRKSGSGILSRADASQLLLQNFLNGPGYMDAPVGGSKGALGLTDGCRVAKLLVDSNDKWDVITGVWIEMLCYVATKCDWKYHIQELSRGGEFLTHFCLLMVNLGLTDQIHHTDLTDYWNVMTDGLLEEGG
ncbi:hypothetical protein Vadar_023733 [Vaccinium darrowii]|uniref:Uncharacterized protein n=1 Tax=Vaccinium darrowii TaxID=229202 RepID=A0ACB7X3G4_9ERIC|nr:hypothetical protein Vadar_023733 [Vaccinium darrowii]